MILKQKQDAINNKILSDQIITALDIMLSNNGESEKHVKQIWDYYPGLFDDEKQSYFHQKQINEFEKFKQRRKNFAKQYNNRFKNKDGDD